MNSITANELKTGGISAFEDQVREDDLLVSVRGKNRFVIMSMEKYEKLREIELTLAIQEAREDIAAGRYVVESVDEHMKRFEDV